MVEKDLFHNCQLIQKPLMVRRSRQCLHLRAFKRMQEHYIFNRMHRFLSTLVKMKVTGSLRFPVIHHPRKFGKSKYNIRNRTGATFIELRSEMVKNRLHHYEIEERV
jgi:hypothetical protein